MSLDSKADDRRIGAEEFLTDVSNMFSSILKEVENIKMNMSKSEASVKTLVAMKNIELHKQNDLLMKQNEELKKQVEVLTKQAAEEKQSLNMSYKYKYKYNMNLSDLKQSMSTLIKSELEKNNRSLSNELAQLRLVVEKPSQEQGGKEALNVDETCKKLEAIVEGQIDKLGKGNREWFDKAKESLQENIVNKITGLVDLVSKLEGTNANMWESLVKSLFESEETESEDGCDTGESRHEKWVEGLRKVFDTAMESLEEILVAKVKGPLDLLCEKVETNEKKCEMMLENQATMFRWLMTELNEVDGTRSEDDRDSDDGYEV